MRIGTVVVAFGSICKVVEHFASGRLLVEVRVPRGKSHHRVGDCYVWVPPIVEEGGKKNAKSSKK